MSSFQIYVNKLIVPLIGSKYHIIIDAGIIFVFSVITFILFKLWLFKEK
jgi:hypothetical protein